MELCGDTDKISTPRAEQCVKSVRIRSYSGQYFPAFRTKYGPKITPNTDTFHAVEMSQRSNLVSK